MWHQVKENWFSGALTIPRLELWPVRMRTGKSCDQIAEFYHWTQPWEMHHFRTPSLCQKNHSRVISLCRTPKRCREITGFKIFATLSHEKLFGDNLTWMSVEWELVPACFYHAELRKILVLKFCEPALSGEVVSSFSLVLIITHAKKSTKPSGFWNFKNFLTKS